MPTRLSNGAPIYHNHQVAAEVQDTPAHAHLVAEQHRGQQNHLTGHEHSRESFEHVQELHANAPKGTTGHGVIAFGHKEIADRAYELWEARGRKEGSPEEDWFRAVKELRARKSAD